MEARSAGAYLLAEVLGEGPTGVVYRCFGPDGASERWRVVKVLYGDVSDRAGLESLRAELARLATLPASQLHPVLDSGFREDGRLWLVSEELPGTDLASAWPAGQRIAPARGIEIAVQVCLAVEAAHAVGVTHGGLKPRNVFLLPGGGVRVLDFGVARRARGKVVFGDPRYLAPEQLRGHCDARSDVYAIGAIVLELITGCRAAGPRLGAAHAVAAATDGLDGGLRRIVQAALHPSPAARMPTVRRLRLALESWAHEAASGEAVFRPGRHDEPRQPAEDCSESVGSSHLRDEEPGN